MPMKKCYAKVISTNNKRNGFTVRLGQGSRHKVNSYKVTNEKEWKWSNQEN